MAEVFLKRGEVSSSIKLGIPELTQVKQSQVLYDRTPQSLHYCNTWQGEHTFKTDLKLSGTYSTMEIFLSEGISQD